MSFISLYLFSFLIAVSAIDAPDINEVTREIDHRIEQERFGPIEFGHLVELIDLLGTMDPEEAQHYLEVIKPEIDRSRDETAVALYLQTAAELARINMSGLDYLEGIEKLAHSKSGLIAPSDYLKSLELLAMAYESAGEEIKAGTLYTRVIEQENDEMRRATVLMRRASLLNRAGKIDLSLSDYMEAIPVFHHTGDKASLINAHISLGRLYTYMGDQDAAIVAYEEAIIIAYNADRQRDLGLGYLNIGTACEAKGDLDKALAFYEKGLEIGLQTDDKGLVAQNYLNVGNVYLKNGNHNHAMAMYSRSLEICYRENIVYGKLMNYMNLGNAYFELKQYKKAVASFDKAYAYAENMNVTNERRELYEKYARVYAGLEDFPNAYYYHTVFHRMESELFNAEKMRVVEELKIAYESELLSQKLEMATLEMERRQAQNNILWISLLALFVGSLVLIVYLIFRKKHFQALYHKNVIELRRDDLEHSRQAAAEPVSQPTGTGTIFDEIEYAMREEKLYTDTELTVSSIARHLQSNTKYVSSAISDHAGMNFNNYVNYFRVNEAKRLILRLKDDANLGDVMQQAGFKSRTTFYNAFRKYTGMSPQKFKSFATNEKISIDEESDPEELEKPEKSVQSAGAGEVVSHDLIHANASP